MKKILLINAGKAFGHSDGKLNHLLTEVAEKTLTAFGLTVKTTHIDNGYLVKEEIEAYVWADAVIYQQPAWWMGPPWILKKYLDEVLTEGHGILYENDGRTRSDDAKKYGSGGLLQGKKYMLSATWNAPLQAFTDPEQFFEGVGVDGVYLPFHKANQFLGMSALPSFMCNDVIKEPHIEEIVESYKSHLREIF